MSNHFWQSVRCTVRSSPRGALALSLPADLPRRDDILISAFAVVAFSVVVQGLTAPVALRALGLTLRKG
jgi:CPA1 family monovalent cation:H+ antiporter